MLPCQTTKVHSCKIYIVHFSVIANLLKLTVVPNPVGPWLYSGVNYFDEVFVVPSCEVDIDVGRKPRYQSNDKPATTTPLGGTAPRAPVAENQTIRRRSGAQRVRCANNGRRRCARDRRQ